VHAYSAGDSRVRAYVVLATVAVVVAIAANAAFDAAGFGPAWLFSSPTVAASYALLYRLVDVRAWRWPVLRATGVIETPIIDGTYEGDLLSTWGPDLIPVRLVVSQRWTRILVRMEILDRDTSTSRSVAASLNPSGHRDAHLTYTYKNEIRPGIADDDMHNHDGTADIDFDAATGTANGKYFNARGRQGTLTLRKV
jgi:hypothetical protein